MHPRDIPSLDGRPARQVASPRTYLERALMNARPLACAAALAAVTVSAVASADPMDPAVERFVVADGVPNCWTDVGEGGSSLYVGVFPQGAERCIPDDAAFKKLIGQYGFAMAPSAMHSARTTGFGGFHLSIEGQYTKVDDGSDALQRGTRGPQDPSTKKSSIINSSPDPLLQVYSLKVRKSFGFGLEIMGAVGFMAQSNILMGGSDVRLSLLEGFRAPDWPGYVPDVAVGGGVRTITGTAAFQLTVASLDTQISKPISISNSSIITPWLGYQYVWIFGDSGLVDLTPQTDPLGYCNYAGDNIPGNWDSEKTYTGDALEGDPLYDGQPVCLGGSREDFNNNVVFDVARFERQRLLFGLNYRYEMVMVGMEFITDLVSPADAQTGGDTTVIRDASGQVVDEISDAELLEDEPNQWTIVFELGTVF